MHEFIQQISQLRHLLIVAVIALLIFGGAKKQQNPVTSSHAVSSCRGGLSKGNQAAISWVLHPKNSADSSKLSISTLALCENIRDEIPGLRWLSRSGAGRY